MGYLDLLREERIGQDTPMSDCIEGHCSIAVAVLNALDDICQFIPELGF